LILLAFSWKTRRKGETERRRNREKKREGEEGEERSDFRQKDCSEIPSRNKGSMEQIHALTILPNLDASHAHASVTRT
jgi:hypothetical protein